MSEAPSSTAWAIIELTSLMTGASSADSRISVTAADHAEDVVGRGHHRAHLVAGHQLQVVERQHVRRVRHGDHQVAALVEADRDGVEAPGRLRADQVQRADVRLVDREVRVVEAEALCGRARQLVAGDRRGLEQDLLGRASRRLALFDGLVDALARQVAHLDDHVGDEARTSPPLRRREPGLRRVVGGGLRLRHSGSPTRYGA
jgi:hypothetical protein